MKKQIKKVLALFLSAMMVLSIVPTSLFAFAEVSASNVTISDVTDSATLSKLSVSAAVPTTVKTQFATNAFTTRAQKNLVAKSKVSLYTDATQNALVTQNNSNISLATLSNGVIANTTNGTRNEDRNYMSGAFSQNNAYLTVELDKFYDISDIYIFSSDASGDSLYDYEVYISETKEGLYNAENLVVDFNYNGYEQYDANRYKGKINLVNFELAQEAISANKYNKVTNANAEGQEYVLGTDIKGKYVGVKLNSYGKNSLFRVSEVGVEGTVSAGQPAAENVTIADITDASTLSKVSVTASLPTTLTTQFPLDAFATRRRNNLVANATEFAIYTDTTQTTQINSDDGSKIKWYQSAMCDSAIPSTIDGVVEETTRISNTWRAPEQKCGYLTMGFDTEQDVGDFYIASSENGKTSIFDYELYASNDRETLYNEENLIVDFYYGGYSWSEYKGKINQTTVEGAETSYIAEVEEFKFSKPVVAKYFGIKMNSFSVANYVRVYEIGLEKFDYYKLDESGLNVNVNIEPIENYFKEGVDYSFKVSVDNGGVLEHLYLDGTEITPNSDGVYTVENSTSSMKLTADVDIDSKKTLSLGIGADESQRNLVWHSTSDKVGKVQFAKKNGNAFPENYTEVAAQTSASINDAGYYANKATITGLEPNTEYVYRIINDKVSEVYTFKTQPKDNFSFFFAGDPQVGAKSSNDGELWTNALNKAVTAFPNSDLLITAGDQVNTAYSEEDYIEYFEPPVMTSLTNAASIGNHDSTNIAYTEHFYNPNTTIDGKVYGKSTAGVNYYYVYNDILFIHLNTNNSNVDVHKEFMQKAVAAHPNVKWKIVVSHHCLYTAGVYYTNDYVVKLREQLVPVYTELGIDAVLAGHNHVYTRSYMMHGFTPDSANGPQSKVTNPTGILYITSNSASGSKYYDFPEDIPQDHVASRWQGGAPSITNVEVVNNGNSSSLKFTTYNLNDMSVIDDFEIEKVHVHTLTHFAKKEATCKEAGNNEYWYCGECGKKFSDAKGENEVQNVTIPVSQKHKEVASVTKATLAKNGTIKYTCSVCKKATKTATTIYYPKTVKLSTTTYTYSGGVKKPSVSVVGSNGKTISSSNYTVSYASGRKYPGKYTVKITFKGNYTGTKTLSFTIKPKKVSLSSVKSSSKKKATVKWSKQSKVSGYQILLATNSKFSKGKKVVTVKGASSKSKTVTKLKSKKTYYVKVRSYKTIDGKKVYGSYSKVKKVKVK